MNGARVLLRAVALAGAIVAPGIALAQPPRDPRSPMPERPTVASHAFTVSKGVTELELGVERDGNPDRSHSWVAPVTVKFGLGARTQLNLAPALVAPSGGSFGAGDLSIGVKYRVLDNAPVVGALAVLPSVKFATGDAAHGTETTDGSLVLISSHQSGDAALDVNVGVTLRSGDGTRAPQRASWWTASGGVPIKGRVGAAIEVFGYPGTSGAAGSAPTAALLIGPTLAVGTYAVFDAGGIFRIVGPQPRAFYAGLTYNLGKF